MALFTRRKSSVTLSPELTAALARGASFDGGDSVPFFETFSASPAKIYRTHIEVRSVVDFLGRNIGQIGIKCYRKQGSAAIETPDHPVAKLLRRPAPGVPRSRFIRQIVQDVAIYDAAFILKVRGEGGRMQLARIPVPSVSMVGSDFFKPTRFQINGAGGAQVVSADDVIWLHGYSPTSNVGGVSPMESLRALLAEADAAVRDRARFWRNSARLSGTIERGVESADVIDQDSIDRWYEEWKVRTSGDKGAGGTPLLPPGFTYKAAASDARSSQYIETRGLSREDVARAYGIPLPVLGLMDTSNWGTDQYHQMLYQDCIGPWITWLQEELEEQLLYAEFEDPESGYSLEFDINQKLKGSFLDQAGIGQQAVGGPWMTRNEFREKFQNLPPIPGGDEIIVPLNVVAGGGPLANPKDTSNQFTNGVPA